MMDLVGWIICRLACFCVGHLWDRGVLYDGDKAHPCDFCIVCGARRMLNDEGRL